MTKEEVEVNLCSQVADNVVEMFMLAAEIDLGHKFPTILIANAIECAKALNITPEEFLELTIHTMNQFNYVAYGTGDHND